MTIRSRTISTVGAPARPLDLRRWQGVKRRMDLMLGLPLLLLALPVIGAAAAAVWLTDRGPVFYRQVRIGRHGRPFVLWKLRTMCRDADRRLAEHLAADPQARAEWAATCKLADDPRILPRIGAPLRRYAVDELPQLWNVVRGDLSLVGPRPLPAYHMKRLPRSVRRLRGRMRPGLTGLWQVARRDRSFAEMQRLDLAYVGDWSPALDLALLARTALVLRSGRHCL
ncbi:sugar transferase [Caenispirillum bisanense]|uniref:Sugar transferase involved in LPS biosynthesis (Colanic, teichoic acid) n=1 Tax=Caenispirillum bisanense TaxID=414052 RepID=A0A286GNT2_9PROT|nr:sugar transferase [Caenispirillum bisanense]SOD97197.1 Sugar transferase involved in LPS biosynthesis (colanic, teichoic acid) [Caenispirillum bisanense]